MVKKQINVIIKEWGENKLVQPSMRFTARCDLERVYDVLKQRELLKKKLNGSGIKNLLIKLAKLINNT